MADKKSVPYHCPLCFDEPECGFHGILYFPGGPKPKCDHHTNDSDTPDLVPMVPARGRLE